MGKQSPNQSTYEPPSADVDSLLGSQISPLALLTGIFFLNFLARMIIAPLLPQMEHDLGFSHSQAGSFFFFITVGLFVGLVNSGWVASYLHHRRTIAVSSMTVGFALILVGISPTLLAIKASLIFLGLGASVYLPSSIATITSLIAPRNWGRALAIHEIAPNLSMMAAPMIAVWLMPLLSWRGVLISAGAVTTLMGLIYLRWGRGGDFPGKPPDRSSLTQLARLPSFWIMAALFALGVGNSMGVYTMLPLYLINERGMDLDSANLLISISRLSGPLMAFVAGWASDRLGPKPSLMVIMGLGGVGTLALGLASDNWIWLVVVIQPLVTACFFPPAFAAISLIVHPQERNLAISMTGAASIVFGAGLTPWLVGYLGEMGYFNLGYIFIGSLVSMGLLLMPGLKFVSVDQKR